ncbi:thioredoxin family protein [Sphingomonas kyeonggiensis]|uniref:Thiol-disulfide isomerase/thioredoxin n=1 Tax=Sphingomonas kyeonggiensis TaxID=1268553 RepID=A0A7W6NXC6_9SPHN|nr:thioredoxin family protein [Sphingomonas kyeonggiensis]MBB4099128.1 thiol-disulfide isomerase/thioredoxin [Sphingomonas kyeonggiensis]
MKSLPVLAVLAVPFLLAAAAPDRAPHVPITSFEQLPKPLPLPYDESANADQAVAAAKLRAKRAGERLIIDLGGNWCLDCRLLAGTLELPALKGWLASRYEIVTVDIGRFDKNLQIPAHYGIRSRLEGVPALLIVDPGTDKLVNGRSIAALADARSLTPQALADWLAQWSPERR